MSSPAQAIKTAIRVSPPDLRGLRSVLLVPRNEFSADLRRRAEMFLETQRTSHPFQLPDWSTEDNTLYALAGEPANVSLFARCDVIWPLGKRFEGTRALTITRGPVCDNFDLLRAFLSRLIDTCRSRGFLYLDLNPDWTNSDADQMGTWLQAQGWFPAGPARASLRVDLRPELEQIRATFRKSTRLEIRRADSAGVKVLAAADALALEQFLDLYRHMARHKGFAPDPEQHIRTVLGLLLNNPGRGVLLNAVWKSEVLGGVVAVRAGARCWYVWGATRKHTQVNVGHLLQWHALQWAKEQGCTEYDLGGYREGAIDGPALFKKGFSETVVRFLPSYRFAIRPARYSAFKLITRASIPAKAATRVFHSFRTHRREG
jgi:hypothetical protein